MSDKLREIYSSAFPNHSSPISDKKIKKEKVVYLYLSCYFLCNIFLSFT